MTEDKPPPRVMRIPGAARIPLDVIAELQAREAALAAKEGREVVDISAELAKTTEPSGSGNRYTHPRVDKRGRLMCRLFKSDDGPLRKLTQRIDGRQMLIPAKQVQIKGKPMTRQERRLVEMGIRREVKRARKAKAHAK